MQFSSHAASNDMLRSDNAVLMFWQTHARNWYIVFISHRILNPGRLPLSERQVRSNRCKVYLRICIEKSPIQLSVLVESIYSTLSYNQQMGGQKRDNSQFI